MKEITTKDIAEFGYTELKELSRILNAVIEKGYPEDFLNKEVYPLFNRNSGYVFLTNEEYQVAMMNGNNLESWYTCSNCGNEGFYEDCELTENGCTCCESEG